MKDSILTQVPVLILGPITIGLLSFGLIPLSYLWITFVMWILISGLGIAVGYHRIFSHKTHTLPKWKENIILFFSVFAAQGSSIFWVAVHRGYHHRGADTERDLHSPIVHGILKSWLTWHYNLQANFSLKYAADLLRKSNHMWFHNNYKKILYGVPFLVALVNWQVAMMMFCLPAFIGNVQDNTINVVGHLKLIFGYRNFATKDNSYNQPLIALFTWGQALHNNHHHDPINFNFGKKWWEIDPSLIFLPFLK